MNQREQWKRIRRLAKQAKQEATSRMVIDLADKAATTQTTQWFVMPVRSPSLTMGPSHQQPRSIEAEPQPVISETTQIASRVRVPSAPSSFICLPSGINLNTAFIVEITAHENTPDEAIVCRWTGHEADSPSIDHFDGDDARAIHAFLGRTKE